MVRRVSFSAMPTAVRGESSVENERRFRASVEQLTTDMNIALRGLVPVTAVADFPTGNATSVDIGVPPGVPDYPTDPDAARVWLATWKTHEVEPTGTTLVYVRVDARHIRITPGSGAAATIAWRWLM